MFYNTANAKLLDYIYPLSKYIVCDSGSEINVETIAALCAEIEKEWNSLNFSFKPTTDEVLKYYNLRNKSDPDDRAFILSDYDYSNCELYTFLRYFVLICSLSFYGHCETIEGAKRALVRGTRALRTGAIISHLKRLRPWTDYAEEFEGWKKIMNMVCSNMFGTTFAKKEFPEDKEWLEIGQRWDEELKRAFEQD
jgi:hypothetical protein